MKINVTPNESKISESLGISEDRFEEIHAFVKEVINTTDTVSGALQKIAEQCQDVQELAFAMHWSGVVYEHIVAEKALDSIESAIKGMTSAEIQAKKILGSQNHRNN